MASTQLHEKLIVNAEGLAFPYPICEDFSEIRRTHWRNSRLALFNCLQMAQLRSTSEMDLQITDHHFLTQYPQYLVSLSHTRGAGGAAIIKKSDNILGIGIDIENKERVIKEGVCEKYRNESDREADNLKLWCAKEAAFKASSYFWKKEKTFVLKDIVIIDNFFQIDQTLKGEITYRLEKGFLITTALVTELI